MRGAVGRKTLAYPPVPGAPSEAGHDGTGSTAAPTATMIVPNDNVCHEHGSDRSGWPPPQLFVGTGTYDETMAETATGRIERELIDEPHIAGRRITVRTIHDRVEGRGSDPRTVADRFDLAIADVYRALAYYHDNPDEMRRLEADRKTALEETRAEAEQHRPPGVDPSSG